MYIKLRNSFFFWVFLCMSKCFFCAFPDTQANFYIAFKEERKRVAIRAKRHTAYSMAVQISPTVFALFLVQKKINVEMDLNSGKVYV